MARKSKLGIGVSQYENKAEYLRQWRELNPGYDKLHRNPEKTREAAWKRRYGLTREQYNDLLEGQDGKCAICKTTDVGRRNHTYFHVDHCHTTGRIRGLLCDKCNRGLGYFNDNYESLIAAADYINR